MDPRPIILATPHDRHDPLESSVRSALPERTVIRIRSSGELSVERLNALAPELVFFPHWSEMIPEDVFSRFECVVFHMTDLPYGRGGSPLQNLIVQGHRDTVLSAFRCTKSLDAGPVYLKRPLSLEGSAEKILRRASEVMADMIVEMVRVREEPVAQSGDATFFRRRTPAESDMASLDTLSKIYDHIRMLDAEGYPPAYFDTQHFHLTFSDARIEGNHIEAKVRINPKTNA